MEERISELKISKVETHLLIDSLSQEIAAKENRLKVGLFMHFVVLD